MLLESFDAGPHWRIVLEPQPEGVYVLVYSSQSSPADSPDRDHLQDHFEMAKLFCREEYGTTDGSWHEYLGPEVIN